MLRKLMPLSRAQQYNSNNKKMNQSSLLSFFYISFSLLFCVVYYYAPFYKFENLIAHTFSLADRKKGKRLIVNMRAILQHK